MDPILSWLESSAVALAFRESMWLYPAVETVHIVGFVVLVGAAFVLDLRLLGWFRELPLRPAVRGLSRWARGGLLLVVPSGVALFVADPISFWGNPAFRIKLLLLVAAGANAALFHRLVFRDLLLQRGTGGRELGGPPGLARLAGVVSIALWLSVIAFGRLIAYV